MPGLDIVAAMGAFLAGFAIAAELAIGIFDRNHNL
jgi:hypothetical protein